MSAPIFFLSAISCEDFCRTKCKLKDDNFLKICIGLIVTDAVVAITALVVGILGVLSVIGMPAAAAYTLIGVSGLFTLPWLGVAILLVGSKIKDCSNKQAKATTKH